MARKERSKKAVMLAKAFGQRLRKIRESRLLSQRQLAAGIAIDFTQISRYERGIVMPNAETAIDLAQFLRVSVGLLLIGEEEPAAVAAVPIKDIALFERFRDLEKLDRKDREIAITVIDALIDSSHHDQVSSRRRRSA
jgi:transcriptional regulator with XRE-family HTH domain